MKPIRGARGLFGRGGRWWVTAALWMLGAAGGAEWAAAQDANAIIHEAVKTELRINHEDRTRWRYLDDERDKGTLSIVVQTDSGSVKRLVQRNGKPISSEESAEVQRNLDQFIRDPAKLAKQRKDGEADDKSAAELLGIMPQAFVWKLMKTTDKNALLSFAPNPDFRPPDMEARVMSSMAGEVLVERAQHRIVTLSGRLTQDVTIGFGLLGRLRAGGTFRVERREVRPGLWQITETHVHIDGKALLFKTIGQQQDEIQTDWTQIPNGTTLDRAVQLSRSVTSSTP